eukprot:10997825-Prorocentrum_lima.AAC.1
MDCEWVPKHIVWEGIKYPISRPEGREKACFSIVPPLHYHTAEEEAAAPARAGVGMTAALALALALALTACSLSVTLESNS